MVIRQTEKMNVLSLLWSAQGRPWRGAVCQSWFNRRKRAFHGLQKNVGGKGWVGYLSSARSLMLSLTLICFGVGGPALARADGELSPGMAAPEFELANLMDDTQRRRSEGLFWAGRVLGFLGLLVRTLPGCDAQDRNTPANH